MAQQLSVPPSELTNLIIQYWPSLVSSQNLFEKLNDISLGQSNLLDAITRVILLSLGMNEEQLIDIAQLSGVEPIEVIQTASRWIFPTLITTEKDDYTVFMNTLAGIGQISAGDKKILENYFKEFMKRH